MSLFTRRAARAALGAALAAITLTVAGCSSSASVSPEDGVVVYSGRSEELVAPLFAQFTEETGIPVEARFGDSAELAAQLLEEGDATPAAGLLLPGRRRARRRRGRGPAGPAARRASPPTSRRPYVATDGTWTGVTGRPASSSTTPSRWRPTQVPQSVLDLTDPAWQGQVAIAPTNASFQSFVTAMRQTEGDEATKAWLEGLVANDVQTYEKNSLIVDAVDAGQAEARPGQPLLLVREGRRGRRRRDAGAERLHRRPVTRAHWSTWPGSASPSPPRSTPTPPTFVAWLLTPATQQWFAENTFEYPLIDGIAVADGLPALDTLDGPDVALADLADLPGTLEMLTEVGLL